MCRCSGAAIRLVAATAVLVLASFTPVHADWQPNGIPLAPDGGTQDIPNLCSDGAEGAFVTWRQTTATDNGDVYLQHVTGTGNLFPGWPTTGRLIAAGTYTQFACNLAPDMLGGVYVVWNTKYPQLTEYRLQRLLPDGTVASGWPETGLILPVSSPFERLDGLCGDGSGGVYAVWTSPELRVLMLHYTGDGQIAPGWSAVGREIIDDPATRGAADVIPASDGGFLATWNDARGGPGLGGTRYGLWITPTGDPKPGWPPGGVRLNSIPTVQEHTFLISDGADGAFVAWNDNRNGVSPPSPLDYDLYAQHLLRNGTVDPRWPGDGLPVSVNPNAQYYFEMAPDAAGGFLVVWDDYSNGAQIYAVRIRGDGTVAPGWTQNGSPVASRPFYQSVPQAVGDGAGGVFAFWDETDFSSAIIGQHLDGAGIPSPGWLSTGKVIAGGEYDYSDPVAVEDGKGGSLLAYVRQTVRPTRTNRIYAQRVYADGPVPTRIAFLDSEVGPGFAHLRWSASDAPSVQANVYRRQDGDEWLRVGTPSVSGESILSFEDHGLQPGRYAYRLGTMEGSEESLTEETWVDVPSAFALRLHGFQPNPAVGTPTVSFTLPSSSRAQLEVFDVRGRLVASRAVGELGAGVHRLPLSRGAPWEAGVYWVRLTHEGRTLTGRGLIIQ